MNTTRFKEDDLEAFQSTSIWFLKRSRSTSLPRAHAELKASTQNVFRTHLDRIALHQQTQSGYRV